MGTEAIKVSTIAAKDILQKAPFKSMELALTALDVTQATGLVGVAEHQLTEIRSKDLSFLKENTQLVKDKATDAEAKSPVTLKGIGALILSTDEVINTVPGMEECLDEALDHLAAFGETMKRYQGLRHSAVDTKDKSQAIQEEILHSMDRTIESFKDL